ncbi:hypothetical protein GCK72_011333 [Caenorhabditis remanei]|uniref:RING-type domain-containing protein n=1 Tax=Caenorhabditis remanei TaxID=31234 RepID=A0A6A5H5Q7_CAERE|nr:hypothetical protein GCK72_011333 [Caenorhabditis remanei]KAF1763068.1 hypothetical protein GCK72_011333 [Caenorhabditis remanei]
MIPIEYVRPLIVWSFIADQGFKQFPSRYNAEEYMEDYLVFQAIWFFCCCLPVLPFFVFISLFGLLFELDKAKLHKFELLIGNGAAVLCPIVSTYLMRSSKVDEMQIYFNQFALLGSALILFYLPYLRSSIYRLPPPFQKIHKLFLVTHGAMICYVLKNHKTGICFMKAVMWILSFVAVHEFWNIYWSDLRVRRENEEPPVMNNPINTIITDFWSPWGDPEADGDIPDVEQEPEIQDNGQNSAQYNRPVPKAPPTQDTQNPVRRQPRLACNICWEDYSKTRIPRVFKECGHSICDECAGRLQKVKNDILHVICPTCKRITHGSELPKNYALIELMEMLEH